MKLEDIKTLNGGVKAAHDGFTEAQRQLCTTIFVLRMIVNGCAPKTTHRNTALVGKHLKEI